MERRLTLNKNGDTLTPANKTPVKRYLNKLAKVPCCTWIFSTHKSVPFYVYHSHSLESILDFRKAPVSEVNGTAAKQIPPVVHDDYDHLQAPSIPTMTEKRTPRKSHGHGIANSSSSRRSLKRRAPESCDLGHNLRRNDYTSKVAATMEGQGASSGRRTVSTPHKDTTSHDGMLGYSDHDFTGGDAHTTEQLQGAVLRSASKSTHVNTDRVVLPKRRKINRRLLKIPRDERILSTSIQYYVPVCSDEDCVEATAVKSSQKHADDVLGLD